MPETEQWDPEIYERFRSERDRPAHDLFALLDPVPAGRVVDLGCGPGHLTRLLADRVEATEAIGIDSSPAMLERAQSQISPVVHFELGDLATWGDPSHPVDVVAANASLHWVPDHPAVLARWTEAIVPGGQLAVQVPANDDHPSHRVAVEVAHEGRFAEAFAGVGGPPPDPVAEHVLRPEAYAELLFDLGYETQTVRLQVYGPVLDSSAQIVDWMQGTSLTRFKKVLDAETYAAFVDRYRERLLEVVGDRSPYYFAFKRILMVARRPF